MYRICQKRVFSFDMDGTLLPNTSACLEIAREVGVEKELLELEASFSNGHINTVDFARAISTLWDSSDGALMRRVFDSAPKLKGIRDVVKSISTHGGRTCLITLSPQYFAEYFREFGFDEIVASTFPSNSQQPIRPEDILTPEAKVDRLRSICARHDCAFDDVVAFGDSASDIPLFASIRWSVCLNGTERLRQAAWTCFDGDNLSCALDHVLLALSTANSAVK